MASRLTGQSIERVEDARLLTGQGRFVGAIDRAGLLHAAFVRSPVAHARLVVIDATRARLAPGVVAVFDGDDIAGAGELRQTNSSHPHAQLRRMPSACQPAGGSVAR